MRPSPQAFPRRGTGEAAADDDVAVMGSAKMDGTAGWARDYASDRAVTRGMALKSLAALGLLAVLSAVILAIFSAQTQAVELTAGVVNVAGRQRMLSQRAALLADRWVDAGDEQARAALYAELLDIARRMEQAHRGLMYGDSGMRLPPAPPEVLALYFEPPDSLNLQIIRYVTAIRELCRDPTRPLAGDPGLEFIRETAYSGTLLTKLDAAVDTFQRHSEARVERLQRFEVLVFGLILATLATTGLLVFRPMVRSVEAHLRQLRDSERRRLELRARLTHVTRLGTMGEMAASLAHEINQPLTAIATYSQACRRLIASGQASFEDLEETLGKVSAQAHRGGEVIRRLRSLGKDGESRRQLARLDEVVEEAVKLAEADARHHDFRIETDFEPALPPVAVDPVQIQQVVLNLIRNGIDACEESAPAAEELRPPIRVSTRLGDDGKLEVAVHDRGCGIESDALSRLFEPFFTTKASGMGVGLAISRSIVTSHGGRLWFENRPGGGAVFRFSLPAAG